MAQPRTIDQVDQELQIAMQAIVDLRQDVNDLQTGVQNITRPPRIQGQPRFSTGLFVLRYGSPTTILGSGNNFLNTASTLLISKSELIYSLDKDIVEFYAEQKKINKITQRNNDDISNRGEYITNHLKHVYSEFIIDEIERLIDKTFDYATKIYENFVHSYKNKYIPENLIKNQIIEQTKPVYELLKKKMFSEIGHDYKEFVEKHKYKLIDNK